MSLPDHYLKLFLVILLALVITPFRSDASNNPPGNQESKDWVIKRLEFSQEIEPGIPLVVDNPYGDIQIKRSSPPFAPVYAMTQKHVSDLDDASITITVSDSMKVEVTYPQGSITEDNVAVKTLTKRRVDLTVYAPPAIPVIATTCKGKIIGKGLKSDVTAKSCSGRIFIRSSGTINATSGSGSIGVYFKKGKWAWPPNIKTTSGEISVRMPPQADASVHITTSGEIATDFSLDVMFQPKSIYKDAYATIGKGTHQVRIQSQNGNVKLLKSREDIFN